MKFENKRIAKNLLAAEGITVLIKDMKSAGFQCLLYVPHKGDYDFCHRELILVEMKNGTTYQILRETVDKNGNFSDRSAKFETREIVKGGAR